MKKLNNVFFRKFSNNNLAIFGIFTFTIILLSCFLGPLFSKYDPMKIDMRSILQSLSKEHILGTDKLGRDIFIRILYGGRLSIFIGFGSAIGAAIIGILIGCYSGYKRGILDAIVLRISEIIMSFPRMILVLILVAIAGQSFWNLILIFMLSGWCPIYRMTRARILSIREEEYVVALQASGINDFLICYKHMLPNALGPIIVNVTLSTATFMLQETSLSFLGLGVPQNIPTWGNMINIAKDITILRENWWTWLPVGIVISLFILSINFIGDGLRDSADPNYQG
jgi:peptide/nickel transport system permease protein